MTEFDRELFLLFNATSEPGDYIVLFAYLMAKYVILAIPIGIALLWIAGKYTAKRIAFALFFALVVAVFLSFTIGILFPVQRPFLIQFGQNLIEHRASPSFPSNHALVMFSCAWTLFFMARRWLAALIAILGVFVAWSRVYLGIHWPFDMVGAAIVAGIAAFFAVAFDRRFGDSSMLITVGLYDRFVEKPLVRVWARLKLWLP